MPTMLRNIQSILKAVPLKNIYLAAAYSYRKAQSESRWSKPRITTPLEWKRPGALKKWSPTPRGASFETENATLEIIFLAADLIRVQYRPAGDPTPLPPPYAIAKTDEEWQAVELTHTEDAGTIRLQSSGLTVEIERNTTLLTLYDGAGRRLRTDREVAFQSNGLLRHATALQKNEHCFGLGEKATPWERRGRSHILWNTDPSGYAPGDEPIHMNIPVYIGLIPGGPSFLTFYENPFKAEFDLGAANPDAAVHTFQGGLLRYYVTTGTPAQLLERYTELTGRHSLPPLWMLGYQQSRWSYYPEARIRKLAEDFRTHEIPCDAIHLDIHYMEGYRVFTWDKERFPNPKGLIADLRKQGIKLVAIIDPGIKQDSNYPVYRSGLTAKAFCQLPNNKTFIGPVWPGECAFPDFTDPQARSWWGEQYRPLVENGLAGYWNDMNEPAVFSSKKGEATMPDVVHHSLEGRGGDHREGHNLYGMQMARASTEGLRKLDPDHRPVVITRSGWAGVQRHATSWMGDNQSTWESMRSTVAMILNLGLSGVSFTGPDTGGFIGTADGELFTRWIQMSAFLPFFRAHTEINSPDQEPWSYGEPYLTIVRRFIQMRYELLPYLYTAVWQMTTRGWPLARPLGWAAPEVPDLWKVDDAFLCGDALLVAPICEAGATTRSVALPPGDWFDFWTHEHLTGPGRVECFAPLETLPLLVRAGTVLPMGDIGPSVEQRPDKFLRLAVYPLTAPGESVSWLYEDAGDGFGYQQGECRVNRFILKHTETHLEIIWEKEGSYKPPYHHIELLLRGLGRVPSKILADGKEFGIAEIDPLQHTVRLGVPPFDRLEITL